MKNQRESITLTHPHDAYRRFKEDEYLSLDDRFGKIAETCGNRLMHSNKGLFDAKYDVGNLLEKQMLEHNLELEKLHQTGNALVTNVRVACERRQSEQREREKFFTEELQEQMQHKSLEIEGKLSKIHERFNKIKSRQDDEPSTFRKTLNILKNQILDLTKSKDEVIQTIKDDTTRINAKYNLVLEKQDYDLHYLMQRVNNYLNNMKQCYSRQILNLDETINIFHQNEYERLYKCRHEFSTEIIVDADTTNMLENIDKKYEVEREHRTSMRTKFRELRVEYDEVTHAFRMRMEKDQENMEMELEEKTATYFLNSLKFNYNYQVLEKKNSENVNQILYEEKKKHWLKSVNYATELRKQIKEAKRAFERKNYEIGEHSRKIRDRLEKLEVKAKNAAADNELKFQNILKMNKEEANDLLTQIFAFNKTFFVEHLGIRWEKPDLNILIHSNVENLQTTGETTTKVWTDLNERVEPEPKWKMLQSVFEEIRTSMGYLMDKDLPEVMNLCKMNHKEKILIQLDNIFCALGFQHSEALTTFVKNLQLFAHCPHCEDEKIIEIHDRRDEQTVSEEEQLPSGEYAEPTSFFPNADRTNETDKIDNVSIDLDLMRCIEELNEISRSHGFNEGKSNQPHQIKINFAHILSALEMTVASIKNSSEKEKEKKENSFVNFDLEQRKSQIDLMWQDYRVIFPEEHVHLWSALEQGLADYLEHLKKRDRLHVECDKLRRQNAQLKYMLQDLL